jgi:phage tail sheath protein FI
VVRAVQRASAKVAEAELSSGTGIRFYATSEGTWANKTTVDIQPVGGGRVTVTVSATDGRRELWRNLDADGLRNHFAEHSKSAESASALVRLVLPADAKLPNTAVHLDLDGGDDGLKLLTPAHLTGDESTATGGYVHGAALLAPLDEVAQVAVPDLVLREPNNALRLPAFTPTAIGSAQAQLVGDCQALQRTALLQHPDANARADEAVEWRQKFDSAYAALYWPWLRTPDPLRQGQLVTVPPCGHVAGIVARSDIAAGRHKPPANETVAGAVGLSRPVDDDDHGRANDAGVNAIRAVNGRGIRVLGARTMSNEPQWRYLNVRRLVTQIEHSLTSYAGWLVFEPDNQSLRADTERVIRQYLDEIWRSGGLDGGTADEAYTVHIEDAEVAAASGDARLVVEIGLQPPWPAEFVVVRIDLSEPGRGDRAGGGGERGDNR